MNLSPSNPPPEAPGPPRRLGTGRRSRRARAGLILSALWLGATLLPAADPAGSAPPPPLESLTAIRRLTPEDFHQEVPVRIRGTVTFTNALQDGYVDGFLHDGTHGIYFAGPVAAVPGLQVGDRMEVEGTAIPGSFAPMVWFRQARKLGTHALPEPRRASVPALLAHPDDSNWVEITGSVEYTSEQGEGWTHVALESGGILLVAQVPTAGLLSLGTNRVGSQLRLRGVATGIFSGQRRMVALRLLVPNPASVEVVNPTPEPLANPPVVPIGSLFGFVPEPLYQDRAKVEGVVTATRNPSEYFLQDASGGLLVRDRLNPSEKTGPVQPGDRLTLSGRLEMDGLQPVMVLPRMTYKTRAALPPARAATADELLSGVVSGLRAEVVAVVHHQQDGLPDTPGMLSCMVSNVPVRVFTPKALGRLPRLPSGTRVRLRGTCLHVSGSLVFRTTPSLEMHLARGEDLEVLARPFIWTARRVGMFAVGLGLAGLGAAGWGITLRRQVRARTLELEKINDLLKTEANSQQMDLAAKATALRRSEERLSLVQEATEDGFWDWNLRSHQCFYGRAWLKMVGYAPGDLPESRAVWANLLHPDDRERVEQETRRFLAGDLPRLEIEYRLQHRAGHWIWVLDRGMVVAKDADGAPLRAVGAITDITEHRRLTLLLGLVLEAGQIGYWNHRLADDSLVWGGHGSAWLGFLPGDMPRTAARFMEWVHPEDRETVWGQYEEFLRKPAETFEIEFRIRNWEGPWRWIFTRARVTERDLQGRPVRTIGIHLDCDRRKQAELELRQKSAELEMSNFALQRAARTRDMFLANMSHELRTPLTSVLTLCELLGEQIHGPLNPRQIQAVQSIESSGRHLLDLINQVLDVARFDAGKVPLEVQSCPAGDLARTVVGLLEAQAQRKGLRLEVHLPAPDLMVQADPLRLRQILVNLIGNALKFTPAGGTVTLGVEDAGDQVLFRVADTGIGISPEQLENIFRPFVQLDAGLNRKHEGSGLGLAIVQRLTELQGGTLEVTSNPGRGSCFSVYLPRAGARVKGGPEQPASPVPDRSR